MRRFEKKVKGQYNIFSILGMNCGAGSYKFCRYIGQDVKHVSLPDKKLAIVDIELYYTILHDEHGKEIVGTPYDISPVA